MTIEPTDQATRNRLISQFEGDIFVEAGAGSGKTTTIINRLVELLLAGEENGGAEVHQIVAVTFTDKAANELKVRLKNALLAKEHNLESPEQRRERAEFVRNHLAEAKIGTIHSFALALLNEFPNRLSLPLSVQTIDETEGKLRFTQWWRSLMRANDLALHSAIEEMALAFNKAATAEAARSIWSDPLVESKVELPPLSTESIQQVLSCAVKLEEVCNETDLAVARPFRGRSYRLDEVPSQPIFRWFTQRFPATKVNIVKAGEHRSLYDANKAYAGARKQALEAIKKEIVFQFFRCISPYAARDRQRRKSEGALSFDDLLTYAEQLVTTNPDVALNLANRYRDIFIDEFQDTDPKQYRLFNAIKQANPGRIRLFVVGDPKQAIYRFRGADFTVYQTVKTEFSNDMSARAEALTANFRSHHQIVEFVNASFADLFAKSEGAQAEYLPMDAHGSIAEEETPVRIIEDIEEGKAAEVRLLTAERASALITELLHGGFKPRDIAVLGKKRSDLKAVATSLRKNEIPFQISSKENLLEFDEIHDLVGVLKAVHDPSDSIAVVAALSGIYGGFSAQELADFYAAGNTWQTPELGDERLAATPLELPTVPDFLAELGRLHKASKSMSVPRLLDLVFERLKVMASAYRRLEDSSGLDRLLAFQTLATQLCEAQPWTLGQFIGGLDELGESGRFDTSVGVNLSADRVELMTIHASKGLEFKVVIVVGLASSNQGRSESWIRIQPDQTLAFKVGSQNEGAISDGVVSNKDKDKQDQAAETLRLLYVAATRAENRLYLCLRRPEQRNGNLLAKLMAETLPLITAPYIHEGSSPTVWSGPPLGMEQIGPMPFPPPTREEIDRLLRGASRFPTISATAVAARAAEWDEADDYELDKETESAAARPTGSSGAALGRAVHSALQLLGNQADRNLDATLNALCAREAIPERTDEAIKLVSIGLDALSERRGLTKPLHTEVFVSGWIGGVLVEGILDVLLETDGGRYAILDYKTDYISSPAEMMKAMSRYRLQAGCYALVVEQTLGAEVESAEFLFLRRTEGRSQLLDRQQLEEAKSAVKEILSQVKEGSIR